MRTIDKLKKDIRALFRNPKPVFFDHLPKCAGSSLRVHIERQYSTHRIFETVEKNQKKNTAQFKLLPLKKKRKYTAVYGHAIRPLLKEIRDDMIRITIFRNPIDRAISLYFYIKRTPHHRLYSSITDNNISLKDFCAEKHNILQVRNWYVKYFSGLSYEQINKQSDYAVNLAFKNIMNDYDLIGFQNEYNAFIKHLDAIAGFQPSKEDSMVRNATANRLKVSELTEVELKSISENNILDIQLFQKLDAQKKEGVILAGRFLQE